MQIAGSHWAQISAYWSVPLVVEARPSALLKLVKPRLAEPLEPVEDVCGGPVVDPLPEGVDDVRVGPVPLAVEVEAHHEEELRTFVFPPRGDPRPEVDAEDTDGIPAAGLVEHVAGIVQVGGAGAALDADGVVGEQGDPAAPGPEEQHPDMLEVAFHAMDGGQVVRPPGRGVVPREQLLEDELQRCLDSDAVDVKDGVLGDADADALPDAVDVVLERVRVLRLDQGGDRGPASEKEEEVVEDPPALSRRRVGSVWLLHTRTAFPRELFVATRSWARAASFRGKRSETAGAMSPAARYRNSSARFSR